MIYFFFFSKWSLLINFIQFNIKFETLLLSEWVAPEIKPLNL